MRRAAFWVVAALGALGLSTVAWADLNDPYYASAHARYAVGDYDHACPDLMTYRRLDRAFLERPENGQIRQQIDQVVRFCERRASSAACPAGYVCQSSGPVGGSPPPDR